MTAVIFGDIRVIWPLKRARKQSCCENHQILQCIASSPSRWKSPTLSLSSTFWNQHLNTLLLTACLALLCRCTRRP
jgi:hypothetical protein